MSTFRFNPHTRILRVAGFVTGTQATYVRLAIDTGASETILTPEALRGCGLDPDLATQHSEVTTASQTEQAPLLSVPRLRALGRSVTNLDVACLSLPPALRLDGLLGLNFFRPFKIGLNFPRGILVVQEGNSRNILHRLIQLVEWVRASG